MDLLLNFVIGGVFGIVLGLLVRASNRKTLKRKELSEMKKDEEI